MYSEANLIEINNSYDKLLKEYQQLSKSIIIQGQNLVNERAKEYILHGVGRRIFVLNRAVKNIFRLFPPDTTTLLKRDTLYDVQINLHAFIINLFGVFENCAWAFVLFHDLEKVIGNRLNISLLKKETKKFLSEPLVSYINSQVMEGWYEYLKSYRHSLAHCIPLYILPASFTDDDAERYKKLEEEQMECFEKLANGDTDTALIDRVEQINIELESIGSPSPVFLYSFAEDDKVKPVFIHPQLIADSRSIIEFVNLFLNEWQSKRGQS